MGEGRQQAGVRGQRCLQGFERPGKETDERSLPCSDRPVRKPGPSAPAVGLAPVCPRHRAATAWRSPCWPGPVPALPGLCGSPCSSQVLWGSGLEQTTVSQKVRQGFRWVPPGRSTNPLHPHHTKAWKTQYGQDRETLLLQHPASVMHQVMHQRGRQHFHYAAHISGGYGSPSPLPARRLTWWRPAGLHFWGSTCQGE